MVKLAIIDNRDSFTFNIYQYCLMSGADVTVIPCDSYQKYAPEIAAADGIILSPGPGSAGEAVESLAVLSAWFETKAILGVCLGHQIIGQYFGCKIIRAKQIYHGKTSQIQNNGQGVFQGLPEQFEVARYHSLTIENVAPAADLRVSATTLGGAEIMGVSHVRLPIFGVQFHPEAILTQFGQAMMDNFTRICAKHVG